MRRRRGTSAHRPARPPVRSAASGAARRPAAWVAFGLVGVLSALGYLVLPLVVQEAVYPVFGLVCVSAVGAGLRLHRPHRPAPWVLLGAGLLLWTLGDLAYSAYELALGAAPFPSWADALYASGYPVMAAALVLVLRRGGVRDAVAWQDAGIWTLAASLLSWEWLVEPIVTSTGDTVLARAVAAGFPLLDLVLLLMVVRLTAGRARAGVYALLALAMSAYLVSDAFYGLASLHGTYRSGGLIDLGWVISYFAVGTLALHPSMMHLTEPPPAVRTTVSGARLRWIGLGVAALLAPGMMAVQHLRGAHVDVLAFAGAAGAMFLLTTLRGAGLVRELETVTARLRNRELQLSRQATTDALTGLANRSALAERLAADARDGRPFCVALIDLDDFKHVNDSEGHEVGDVVLLEVAEALRAGAGPADLVARLGGDEFAVVSAAPADALLDRLVRSLPRAVPLSAGELLLRASIGVASSEQAGPASPADLPSALLRHADIAMYAAKAQGGATASVYRPEMSAELLMRLETRRRLTEAVRDQEFVAWLQPVVDLATHRLIGFEALARWHPEGGLPIGPDAWMPAAEASGLVVQVDVQVLRAAARQLAQWTRTVPGAESLELAVNASGRSLQEPDVAHRILAVLREEGLEPSRVLLEVTEGVLIDESVGTRLQVLRDAGMRIALDDFGTGWSSLSYLRRFPVDLLKIDRSFVVGLGEGTGAEAVPAAVLQLAAALDLDVIAEGVETTLQAQVLRRLGCRTVQGYLYGRPAPPHRHDHLVRLGRIPGAPALDADLVLHR